MAHLDGPIVTFDDHEGALTFGIEIEWLSPYLPYGCDDPNPEDPRPVFKAPSSGNFGDFAQDLMDFTLAPLQNTDGITIREECDDIFVPPHDNVPEYDVWRLCQDTSVLFLDEKHSGEGTKTGYDWVGREITSPVFDADDATSPKMIEAICGTIRSHRAHLNKTASIHVHVGRGDLGLTLTTVKKFTTLIWLIEEKLLDLHHPCRKNNYHCPLLSKVSRLATIGQDSSSSDESDNNDERKHEYDVVQEHHVIMLYDLEEKAMLDMEKYIPTDLDKTLRDQLKYLWGISEADELALCYLAQLMIIKDAHLEGNYSVRGSIGYRRFLPKGKTGGNTNTLEFRQMTACLDPDPIIHWVRVCVGIVNFARLSDAAIFKSRLDIILKLGDKYTGIDLLSDLGLTNEAEYYRNQIAKYELGTPEALAFYNRGPKGDALFIPPLTDSDLNPNGDINSGINGSNATKGDNSGHATNGRSNTANGNNAVSDTNGNRRDDDNNDSGDHNSINGHKDDSASEYSQESTESSSSEDGADGTDQDGTDQDGTDNDEGSPGNDQEGISSTEAPTRNSVVVNGNTHGHAHIPSPTPTTAPTPGGENDASNETQQTPNGVIVNRGCPLHQGNGPDALFCVSLLLLG